MFRYIPFGEIDKNKWNGTVHYALNGNIQGYYWYLKAVLGEWGAIIENDYESVVPVFLEPLKEYQYTLLKELGPYSVNMINSTRANEIFTLMRKHHKSSSYPINSRISSSLVQEFDQKKRYKAIFGGGVKYLKLSENYSDAFTNELYENGFDDIKIMGGKKPEEIVELLAVSHEEKNALMRIMYNAMHRGIGFSNGIEDAKSGKILALSFFIGTPTSVHELTSYTNGSKKYRQLIFDLLLRKNAERPVTIESFHQVNELQEIGFDIEPVGDIHFPSSPIQKIKKAFGGSY